mmetsp:Transcript_3432/g.4650  ORF Transcript_3432/g.4650 Transcript_3432/m.4650 type:complete len:305 (-) Transcript_3432:111-1025(-)|eukprot:CAMPEP_0185725486 /NCGR_PEP_ID=MMETSP1171-20130828/1740_1 /TAXON_ID=374046 /ORGANISM="Helicotheca tamensis, Strain CCMP826" /LENGTH=304 /DNA_ID=CAMNT_0028393629 /DNA_START=45 /DNA_END=959 /DNA_ORIENTATION=+
MKFSLALSALAATTASAFVPTDKGFSRPSFGLTQLNAERQPIMAGNWKMNPPTEEDALALATEFSKLIGDEACAVNEFDGCTEIVLFPPFPFISKVKDAVEDIGISVGAQGIFYEEKGAYTGSVAASMVKSVGCEFILCGHSERRILFNDDDVNINAKVKKVLESDMKPILCVGETKEELDLGITKEVCAMQLSKDLAGVTKEEMADVVIAYEPVWAIGTGLVCEADAANAMHAYIRECLASMYDDEVAQATRIQYGGSVTPDSVDGLMAQPDIDGCLVGGASLTAEMFARICNFQKADATVAA